MAEQSKIEQELIERNKKLNPRGEIARYLAYVAEQAGFDFESDPNVVDKHYRYVIRGEFPCKVQGRSCVLELKTRDALVACVFGGDNGILDQFLTLSFGRKRCTGKMVDGHYLTEAELKKGFFPFETKTRLDRGHPMYEEWRQRVIEAKDHVRSVFPNLEDLARAPRYFSLRTYQGDPKQLPEGVQREIEVITTSAIKKLARKTPSFLSRVWKLLNKPI